MSGCFLRLSTGTSASMYSYNYKAGDRIDIAYTLDLITGQCRASIGRMRDDDPLDSVPAEYDLFAVREFLLGVPIQLAQVGTDYLGVANSTVNAVASGFNSAFQGFATGGLAGAVVNVIASASNGIYNTVETAMPVVETSGTNGSFLNTGFTTHYVTQFFNLVDEDIEHRGRPLCEIRQLGSLSGFILCAEGEMDLNCFDNERKEILRFLTTGFFME